MTYPASVTYTGADLEAVRQELHYLGQDEQPLPPDFIDGAEAILTWLAGGKPSATAYGGTNTYLKALVNLLPPEVR